jgi:hypothetical protein
MLLALSNKYGWGRSFIGVRYGERRGKFSIFTAEYNSTEGQSYAEMKWKMLLVNSILVFTDCTMLLLCMHNLSLWAFFVTGCGSEPGMMMPLLNGSGNKGV